MNSLSSNRFQPSLESLTDRIVPSTAGLITTANRLFTLISDAKQINVTNAVTGSGLAAVQTDIDALKADIPVLKAELNTNINNLVAYYKSQDSAYQAAARDTYVLLIYQMQQQEQAIENFIGAIGTTVQTIVADVNNIKSGALSDPLGFDYAKATDQLNAHIAQAIDTVPLQIADFLTAGIDLYSRENLIDQVCVAPATAAAQSAAAQSSCCN